jgi:F0F1-type ATP synthase membrane subunit c/vacuolar-type H+-ATPase subunit K
MQVSLSQDTLDMLRKIFYALAGITLIITRYIKRFVLSAGGRGGSAMQSSESPVLQKYATAMIIAWALSESIGLYGLVLFLLGRNTTDLYLLILIAAAALLLYRPGRDEIMSLPESSAGGGAPAGLQ